MTAASPFDGLPGGWLTPRRTLLLVGNLPVMSALWISQYADREARENGPVCLVRESGDCVQIELFRAGSRLPTIRPQASYEEALRAVAPIVSQWLVVARQSEPVEISHGTDDIVVLTGSDQAAIVAAYRLVKAAHDAIERLGGARPAVSVAVLGADAAETAHVAARIGEAASSSLSISIPDCSALHLRRVHSVEPSRVPLRASPIFVKSSRRPPLTRRAVPWFRRRSLQRCRLRRPTPRPQPRPRPSRCASHLASNARARARGQRLTRFHSDPISHHAVAAAWNPFALRHRLRRRKMQRVKFSPTRQARCAK